MEIKYSFIHSYPGKYPVEATCTPEYSHRDHPLHHPEGRTQTLTDRLQDVKGTVSKVYRWIMDQNIILSTSVLLL